MTTLTVETAKKYQIHIGRGILGDCARLCPVRPGSAAFIVTDGNAGPMYAERVRASFAAAGCRKTAVYTITPGEASKNMDTVCAILGAFAREGLGRGDFVAALGGGVVGDVAGFAAAIYMRGIPYVQLPTTLLAAVDSSVGGKTGVDLPAGKNLAGAFHHPEAVVCDVETLVTLPPEARRDGLCEVIKYGMIADSGILDRLDSGDLGDEEMIAKCAGIKASVVAGDEFDRGGRAILNFGHTAGHAVELLSGYAIPHGRAVAIGMLIITRAAEAMGVCKPGAAARLERVYAALGIDASCPYDARQLASAAMGDKKREGDTITLVLPESPGKVILRQVPTSELEHVFQMGL